MGWLIALVTLRWLREPLRWFREPLFFVGMLFVAASIVVYALFGDASVPYVIGTAAIAGGLLGVAIPIALEK